MGANAGLASECKADVPHEHVSEFMLPMLSCISGFRAAHVGSTCAECWNSFTLLLCRRATLLWDLLFPASFIFDRTRTVYARALSLLPSSHSFPERSHGALESEMAD